MLSIPLKLDSFACAVRPNLREKPYEITNIEIPTPNAAFKTVTKALHKIWTQNNGYNTNVSFTYNQPGTESSFLVVETFYYTPSIH